jgi:hypothetical protein
MTGAPLRSWIARLAAAALGAVLLLPSGGAGPVAAAEPPLPTFGNPTISGIQGFGFEQDLRLDTHGRVYTSVPGSLGSNLSYAWRSLNGGETFKWLPAAAQPVGKLFGTPFVPMCNGGGDTELATDSADRLYINDLALHNYGTARSDNHGQTLTTLPICASVFTAPDDRPWYAVDGDPMNGGSITLAYNVAPNATPISLGKCTSTNSALSNKLVFASSPLPDAPLTAGLQFGAPQVLTQGCDEGIMGNDEVFTYGSVKRVFVMHNNDALNQMRMARCDIVPVTVLAPSGYTNCVDKTIFSDTGTVNGGDFPTLTIDRAGNLFAVWEQASCGPCAFPANITSDTLLYYAVSKDQGDTWTAPRILSTGLHTNVFAWPAAGDSGRVDVGFYGTTASKCCHGPDSTSGDWSLYMVQSLDFTSDNPHWTQPILAGEHFTHRGTVQTLMGGQTGDRTLGDFFQVRIGLQGEANISYADSNSTTEAFASQGMFVRQNGGTSVFADRPVVHGAPLRVNSVTVGDHPATLDSAGISSPNQPNLEILGSQISLSSDKTQYQVKALVADLRSLAPGPGTQGTTLVWNTQWKVPSSTDLQGGAYFHAYMESVAGAAPTFWVGQNALEFTGSFTQTYPGSTKVTGSYTPTAPGVITINVPVDAVNEPNPLNGLLLYSVTTASMTLDGNAEIVTNMFGVPLGGTLFNLVDVAPAYDFNPAVATPPFQICHEADGDGDVNGRNGGSAHFHFDRDACAGDGATEGVDERDPASGADFHSTSITAATFDDITHTATIVGDGTNAGRPVSYTMVGIDNGALPGLFSLVLNDGYAISGTLLSGSIQLR